MFDSTYATFRLPPWGAPKIRAVKKEQKLYLWDWARVPSLPARLENLVAAHLYRFCDFMKDIHGEKTELRYFRDVLGHEVDFIVTRSGKPWFAVEVKTSFEPLDKGLRYLLERVHVPQAFQISLHGDKDVVVPKINGCEVRMLSASHFLAHLP